MKKFSSKLKLMLVTLFALISGSISAAEVTDVLNQSVTGVTGTTYTDFIDKSVTSDVFMLGCALEEMNLSSCAPTPTTVASSPQLLVVLSRKSLSCGMRTLPVDVCCKCTALMKPILPQPTSTMQRSKELCWEKLPTARARAQNLKWMEVTHSLASNQRLMLCISPL